MDDELAALMAQLEQEQTVAVPQQQQSKLQRVPVNDRMLGELIMAAQLKLQKQRGVRLLFLTDGSGVVTVEQLRRDIVRETDAVGGRCAVVDLPSMLSVESRHVEAAIPAAIDSAEGRSAGLQLVENGAELVTNRFIDGVLAAARQQLAAAGSCAVADIARQCKLSSGFVHDLLLRRLVGGGDDDGTASASNSGGGSRGGGGGGVRYDGAQSVLYTERCVAAQVRALECALLARSAPVSINEVYERHAAVLMPAVRSEVVARAAAPSSLLLQRSGTFDAQLRTYTPLSHEQQLSDAVHAQYTAAKYIRYDALAGIADAAVFLASKYNNNNNGGGGGSASPSSPSSQSSSSGAGRGRGGKSAKRSAAASASDAVSSSPTATAASSNKLSGHALSEAFVSDGLLLAAAQKLDLDIAADDQAHQQQHIWHVADCVPPGALPSSSAARTRPQLRADLCFIAEYMLQACPSIAQQCVLVDSAEHDDATSDSADSANGVVHVFFLRRGFFGGLLAAPLEAIAMAAASKHPRPTFTETQLAAALRAGGPSATPAGVKAKAEREYVDALINKAAAREIRAAIAAALSAEQADDALCGLLQRGPLREGIAAVFTRVCLPHRAADVATNAALSAAAAAAAAAASSSPGDDFALDCALGVAPAPGADTAKWVSSGLERAFLVCQLLKKFLACAPAPPDALNATCARTAGAALLRFAVLDGLVQSGGALPPPDMPVERIIRDLVPASTAQHKTFVKLLAALRAEGAGSFVCFVDLCQAMSAAGTLACSVSLRALGKKEERDALKAEADSLSSASSASSLLRVVHAAAVSPARILLLAMRVAARMAAVARFKHDGALFIAEFDAASLPPPHAFVGGLRAVLHDVSSNSHGGGRSWMLEDLLTRLDAVTLCPSGKLLTEGLSPAFLADCIEHRG